MVSDDYHSKGFQMIPGLFTIDELMPIRNLISELVLDQVQKLSGEARAKFDAIEYSQLPHAGVAELARIDNEHVRQINDELYTSPLYYSLLTQEKVLSLACQFAGASQTQHLGFVGFSFRVDLPHEFTEQETRLSQPWHQDTGYYSSKICPQTSAVFWVPLYDCNVDDGCLEAYVGSQKSGHVDHIDSEIVAGQSRHTRVTIPQNAMEDSGYERTFIEADAGDALVMHIALMHRSGRNLSDNVRYSLLVRTSNMLSPTYVA